MYRAVEIHNKHKKEPIIFKTGTKTLEFWRLKLNNYSNLVPKFNYYFKTGGKFKKMFIAFFSE